MSASPALPTIAFRPATEEDCADLALLADMATRRLTSFLWGRAAAPGQSAFEIGRGIIRNDESHPSHFRNWRIAEHDGKVAGAVNGYVQPAPSVHTAAVPDVVEPLNELKAMAAGTWYLSAAALFPEHQGKGFGQALLAEAERLARRARNDRLTLMVGSFNPRAYRLYQKAGFQEWSRRPFLPFAGSDAPGEWILMVKDLPEMT